jgi:polyisoprenoid-binding protein YceI
MAVSGGTIELGPSTARLRLHTSREGVAARVGHDLEITFETWSGRLTLDGADLAASSVQAEFDPQDCAPTARCRPEPDCDVRVGVRRGG